MFYTRVKFVLDRIGFFFHIEFTEVNRAKKPAPNILRKKLQQDKTALRPDGTSFKREEFISFEIDNST